VTTAQDAIRAGAYQRISDDKAGDEHGVANQLADQQRMAQARGWTITLTESDNDISALKGRHRPGYEAIMAAAAAGEIDVILVFQTSRLWRNRRERAEGIEVLRKAGVSVVATRGPSLDMGTAYGRAMAGLLGEFDTMESEVKSERQQLAEQQAAQAGKPRLGTPRPFGWQPDRVTLDEAEAAAIRSACASLLHGGTITGACRDWERRGLRPHQVPFGPLPEHPWTTTSVRLILRNPRNAGIAVYKGAEVGRGQWTAIVAEETYRAVAALLADPARKPSQGVRSLLGHIALCRCGNYVTGSRGANGQPSYRCNVPSRGDRPGPHVFVSREFIDAYADAATGAWLAANAGRLAPASASPDAGPLRDEAAAIRGRLARLGPLFALGAITEQDMTNGRAQGDARLAVIAGQLAEMGRDSVLAPYALAADAAQAWRDTPADRKRAVIAALWTITLLPSGRGARTFRPETVDLRPRLGG
jgi:DNA invertase Pin-like site-specific DNA recombinase